MRKMGIAALGPRPRTTKPGPGHKIFRIFCAVSPSSRRTRCGAQISPTFRLGRGLLYQVAIMDWASRAVLAWRLSNTMDVSFCVSPALPLLACASSMDGRGRWMDNVFIERLWRSLKHEDIYLMGYADGREAHSDIASWFAFYNTRRPHQGLDNRTPVAVWRDGTTGALGEGAVDMMDNARALP